MVRRLIFRVVRVDPVAEGDAVDPVVAATMQSVLR
jgi:hypothetical protein